MDGRIHSFTIFSQYQQKKRILNILFWSVISAAFIGTGTNTTAAKSGAAFGAEVLWALLFSTFACLLLQEAAARLTIVSGKIWYEQLFLVLRMGLLLHITNNIFPATFNICHFPSI